MKTCIFTSRVILISNQLDERTLLVMHMETCRKRTSCIVTFMWREIELQNGNAHRDITREQQRENYKCATINAAFDEKNRTYRLISVNDPRKK